MHNGRVVSMPAPPTSDDRSVFDDRSAHTERSATTRPPLPALVQWAIILATIAVVTGGITLLAQIWPTATATRPLGVWLFTLGNLVLGGLLPLGIALLQLRTGIGSTMLIDKAGLVLSAALGVGIIGAACGAWLGANPARIALLALTVVLYGFACVGNLRTLVTSAVQKQRSVALWGLLYTGSWLGLNLWYFLRPEIVAWYTRT